MLSTWIKQTKYKQGNCQDKHILMICYQMYCNSSHVIRSLCSIINSCLKLELYLHKNIRNLKRKIKNKFGVNRMFAKIVRPKK